MARSPRRSSATRRLAAIPLLAGPLSVPKAPSASLIYRRFRADPPRCGSAPALFFLSRVGASPPSCGERGAPDFARILRVVDPRRTTDFSSFASCGALRVMGNGSRGRRPPGYGSGVENGFFSPTSELFEALLRVMELNVKGKPALLFFVRSWRPVGFLAPCFFLTRRLGDETGSPRYASPSARRGYGPTLRVMGFRRRDDLGNVRTLRGWIGTASGCTLRSGTSDRARGGRGMDSFIGDAPEPKWPQHGPYSSSARADSAGSPDAEGLPWIRSRGAFLLSILFTEKTVELELMTESGLFFSSRRAFRGVSGLLGSSRRGEGVYRRKTEKKLTTLSNGYLGSATMKNAAKCDT
ncbi:hypothetical protein R1flu_003951 [Riccia fluitans]|uniref:Ribosomal protein L2 n=1 Tax=Riccia fluitans TaxID=41844 RepID=A0ABD1YRX4_9MARC